jgi:hypothetical protein
MHTYKYTYERTGDVPAEQIPLDVMHADLVRAALRAKKRRGHAGIAACSGMGAPLLPSCRARWADLRHRHWAALAWHWAALARHWAALG